MTWQFRVGARRRLISSRPLPSSAAGEDWDFDLIFQRPGSEELERVQVKYVSARGNVLPVRTRSSSLTKLFLVDPDELLNGSCVGRPNRRERRRRRGGGLSERAYWNAMAFVPPERHLLRAKDLADARYFEPLDVDSLADSAGLSRAHFTREFKRAFGESPHHYLRSRRLERAAALLRTTDHSVAEICLSVGLRSIGSFTSSFAEVYGRTPTEYRASYPPAAKLVLVPLCVQRLHGRAAQDSTFGEDRTAIAD